MALAQDLMGLGENPNAAAHLANGGVGPVSMTVTGTTGTTAGATQIYGQQYVTSILTVSGGGWLMLPSPTGVNPPYIYDDYVSHNATGGSVTVSPPPGVTINIGGVERLMRELAHQCWDFLEANGGSTP